MGWLLSVADCTVELKLYAMPLAMIHFVGSVLSMLYADVGLTGAHKVFDVMAEQDCILWNMVMDECIKGDDISGAEMMFRQVKTSDCKPNIAILEHSTFVSSHFKLVKMSYALLDVTFLFRQFFSKCPSLKNKSGYGFGAPLKECIGNGDIYAFDCDDYGMNGDGCGSDSSKHANRSVSTSLELITDVGQIFVCRTESKGTHLCGQKMKRASKE